MVNHEGLIKHLSVCGNGPFGLLSQQALSTDGLLFNMFGERLAALFSAEHGWFGLAAPGERTEHEMHPYWHIPVHSLYGETRRPTPEMLQGLERIVIDLQDIGVRCYTYLATLKNMLEAAAEAHLPVTVLDRWRPPPRRICPSPCWIVPFRSAAFWMVPCANWPTRRSWRR